MGWVYFDYHGRNMVFQGEAMRGLFDFDDVGRGPLVYDLTARLRREVGTMRAMRAEMARIGSWLSLPTGVVNIGEADTTA